MMYVTTVYIYVYIIKLRKIYKKHYNLLKTKYKNKTKCSTVLLSSYFPRLVRPANKIKHKPVIKILKF